MRRQDRYTLFIFKPSTFRRKYRNAPVSDAIRKFIQKHGFKIMAEKQVKLTDSHIYGIYKEEISKWKKRSRKEADKLYKWYRDSIQKGPNLILLAYHPRKNAKKLGTKIKGESIGTYSPRGTIRHIFMDRINDGYKIKPGKITMFPSDNVIHSSRNDSEFNFILKNFFPGEYKRIAKL